MWVSGSNMKRIPVLLGTICCICAVLCLMTSKTYALAPAVPPNRNNNVAVTKPGSPGLVTYQSSDALIDASNTAEGYIMVKYTGKASAAKVQMTCQGQETYTYNLRADGQYEVYPLSSGNGTYQVMVYAQVVGSQYAVSLSKSIPVQLRSPVQPFLYPNQYVNFNDSAASVLKANELAKGTSDKLSVVSQVYNFVINNISYDDAKAKLAKEGKLGWYIPNVDDTLAVRQGICFDYAALMAAMLRSQQIPTKVEVGYITGGTYHAWVSVYLPEEGWINGVIYFDGKNWRLMDPTLAAGNKGNEKALKFITDANNYKAIYVY